MLFLPENNSWFFFTWLQNCIYFGSFLTRDSRTVLLISYFIPIPPKTLRILSVMHGNDLNNVFHACHDRVTRCFLFAKVLFYLRKHLSHISYCIVKWDEVAKVPKSLSKFKLRPFNKPRVHYINKYFTSQLESLINKSSVNYFINLTC